MLRSLCNFGRAFAAAQNGHQHVKYSQIGLSYSSLSKRCIHTNVILLQQLNASSEPASSVNDDIPIVSITGIPADLGSQQPYSAVYWGSNDSMNILKPQQTTPNAFVAAIEACQLALEQAVHDRQLDKVIVRTDSEYLVKVVNQYLKNWRKNDYVKRDGSSVKHKDEIKKLDELLSMINAKFEYVSSEANNYVLEQLKNDSKYAETVGRMLNSKLDIYDPTVDTKNVIFVTGAAIDRKAAYGIHFKGNEELNAASRFTNFPVSLPRAFMFGIIQALHIAKEKGFKDVVIVTDNSIFLRCFQMGWKTRNGELAKNSQYYETIKKAADELNASFRFIPSDDNDSNFKNSVNLAYDALTKSSYAEKPSKSQPAYKEPVD